MRQDSRHIYHRLLREKLNTQELFERFAALLSNDPYFMPAHLEMLWFAEESQDKAQNKCAIDFSYNVVTNVALSKTLRAKLSERWSACEVDALMELLSILGTNRYLSSIQRAHIKILQRTLIKSFTTVNTISQRKHKHLRLVRTIDVSQLKEEVLSLPYYWWFTNKTRHQISSHQNTRSIALRIRPSESIEYLPVDDVHESYETQMTKLLPKTHAQVLLLAETLGIALNRVVLVRAGAGAQVYRHYDSEPWLANRERYHLVIYAGRENILSCADESVNALPGQLWFFDNKVSHRAHNKSNLPRTHLIFDGYRL